MPEATPVRSPHLARARTLDLYLLRGLLPPFLVTLLVAGLAMMLERALRLAHEMAAGGADLSFFLPMLAQLVPYYVALALPAAFMIALIFLIARLDEAQELESILAGGVSLARIAAPLVVFGIAVAAFALVANGWLEPHGRYGLRTMRVAAVNAVRVGRLQPGAFYAPAEGLTVTLDRADPSSGRAEGVFVRQRIGDGRERILTASSGRIGFAGGSSDLLLTLDGGLHYQDPDTELRQRALSLRFDLYALREPMLLQDSGRARGGDQKELTLAELADSRMTAGIPRPVVEAELYGRLARSLTIPLLPLLAVPLAFAAKKGRRGLGILVGGALLMGFHHGLNFTKKMVLDGSPDPALAIGGLCAAFAAVALALFVTSRHLPSHSPVARLSARLTPLVPRRRRERPFGFARLPGSTLGGYVAAGFLKWTLAAALTVLLLLQMVDLIEHGDDFVERGFDVSDIGFYAWLRLPLLLQQTFAIAALAGAMFILLRLVRFHESVAIRAAGVSQFRLLLMLLPVALLVSAASFAISDRVAPPSAVELAAWWKSSEPGARQKERWFRISGDIVRAEAASADGREIRNLTLYRRDSSGLLAERVTARSALLSERGWELREARGVRPTAGGAAEFAAKSWPWETPLRAGDVRAFFAAAPHLSAEEARRAIEGAAPVAEGILPPLARLERRLAEPLAPLVMLLLALPLALASSRTGPSWPLLLYPIGAGIAFLVSDGVLAIAAQLGLVSLWVGAWAAPLAFGLLAVTILVYTEA